MGIASADRPVEPGDLRHELCRRPGGCLGRAPASARAHLPFLSEYFEFHILSPNINKMVIWYNQTENM
jgi:hypothetical protein